MLLVLDFLGFSFIQTQEYDDVRTVWSVLPGNLSPLTMIFPVCDPDEMRLVTDSDPIIGSWPGGEGAVDVVSEMGLSRLTYFNVINWEDHIRLLRGWVLGQCRLGHRGLGSGLQMWPLSESPPGHVGRCPWCGVCCPCVPIFSWCLPQFLDATFTCHQPLPVTVTQCGSYPGPSGGEEANWSLTDFKADWPYWQPAERRVGGCDAEIVSIFGMSIVN